MALLAMLVLCTGLAFAKDAVPESNDPVLEARLMAIAEELRCLVCQNQTIADSNAALAVDLRNQIRSPIGAGRSDDAIRPSLVPRYGAVVLYRPPFQAPTGALHLTGDHYLVWATLGALEEHVLHVV